MTRPTIDLLDLNNFLCWHRGAHFNYVDKILACFDNQSRVDISKGIPLLLQEKICILFQYHLPTSSFQHNLWTSPFPKKCTFLRRSLCKLTWVFSGHNKWISSEDLKRPDLKRQLQKGLLILSFKLSSLKVYSSFLE